MVNRMVALPLPESEETFGIMRKDISRLSRMVSYASFVFLQLSLPPRVEREDANKDKGMSGTLLAVYLLLFIIVCSYAYDLRIKYLL